MNYCVPCRRPLNNTVTCPECGAYDDDMALPGGSGDGAPAVDTAAMEALFSVGPDPVEPPAPSPAIPAPRKRAAETAPAPASPTEVPEGRRRHGAPRWKKYGARTLAAAAFTMLGGIAAGTVLPDPTAKPQSADLPDVPPGPEQSPTEPPQGHATAPPRASSPPERAVTHPARGSSRDRADEVIRPPRATVTHPPSHSPTAPPATTTPPSATPTPAPHPSSGRPSPSPTPTAPSTPPPTATPTPSPSSSTGTPPTDDPTPSPTVRPLADALRGGTERLLPR
ncbi:SCO2400 family protein [Streptomyces sp. NRRL S-118]|uniref:SCO2400 family protein n=1 Tax=Streptomyces sp. NRRL S-118 TaxID=1463881 RepID=UPI003B641A14